MEKCILDLTNEERLVLRVKPRAVITQTLNMRRYCVQQSLSSMFSLEERFSLCIVHINLCYPEDMEGKLFLEVIVAFELTGKGCVEDAQPLNPRINHGIGVDPSTRY